MRYESPLITPTAIHRPAGLADNQRMKSATIEDHSARFDGGQYTATQHVEAGGQPPPARSIESEGRAESNPVTHRAAPGWPEWMAAAAVMLAFFALGAIRIPCDDTTWHLATARVAEQIGHWPVVNTFSHTHTDHPLYQQYPLFQSLLYRTFHLGGWPAISALNCAGWLIALLLFVRWSGSWRRAVVLHLPWMIGVMALQRRMIPRPDMFSVIGLGLILLLFDRYRRSGRWAWLAPIPFVHLLWSNAHQLFPLGLAVQGLMIIHIALSRRGWTRIDQRDASLPMWPIGASLLLSVVASLFTPLGLRIVEVVAHTGGSLTHHRDDVQEFARVWTQPIEWQLTILCFCAGAWAAWRIRRRMPVFELGLWLATMAMTLAAVRGLVFFGLVSIGLLSRSLFLNATSCPPSSNRSANNQHSPRRTPLIAQWAMVCLTLVIAAKVVFYRWVEPPLVLGGTQPGWGRSLGDWPDGAIAFLKRSPPPGQMMNMPWSLADALIWELPEIPVFVDPRLESYPREFLIDCMASYKDDAVLDRLIRDYDVDWIIANHRDADVRERVCRLIESKHWSIVYADTGWLILVLQSARTSDYLSDHSLGLENIEPIDLLDGPAQLRARQRIHFAQLLDRLGMRDRATEQRTIVRGELPADQLDPLLREIGFTRSTP